MKKLIALIMVLCMVLSVASTAFAGRKPTIKTQPVSATTDKKGSVSFSVKVNTNGNKITYSWRFINPSTGEEITAKNISKTFSKIKVNGANKAKLTLKNVPDEMHGWKVYCHINGNGYKLNTDEVILSINGLESTGDASSTDLSASETVSGEQAATVDAPAEQSVSETPPPAQDENQKTAEGDASGEEPAPVEVEDKTITIVASSNILRNLDSLGKPVDMEPVSTLEFVNIGSFVVTSEQPIKNWTINGTRFEPAQELHEIKLINVSSDTTVSIQTSGADSSPAQLDTDHMCKVTCKDCSFTFLSLGIRSASEGEVPSGARIRVLASSSEKTGSGYTINGEGAQFTGLTSFVFTVTEDVEISLP